MMIIGLLRSEDTTGWRQSYIRWERAFSPMGIYGNPSRVGVEPNPHYET